MSDAMYLTPGQQIKPNVSETMARKLVEQLYGLKVQQLKQLNSYDDINYHVICERDFENTHMKKVAEDGYTLKIKSSLYSQNTELLEAQIDLLLFCNQHGFGCPIPVKQKSGSYFSLETLEMDTSDTQKVETKEKYAVRLVVFKPGVLLSKVPITADLMTKLGHLTAKLDHTFAGFSHPVYEQHSTIWCLQSLPRVKEFVYAIDNEADRDFVSGIMNEFEEKVVRIIDKLEKGIIHGDLNESNVIVDEHGQNINAIIDFDDSNKGCLIFELAIVMCYMIILTENVDVGKYLLKGYQKQRAVKGIEKNILKLCICARICQSLVLGAYTYKLNPGNEYLLTTQKGGWKMLKQLWFLSDEDVYRVWDL